MSSTHDWKPTFTASFTSWISTRRTGALELCAWLHCFGLYSTFYRLKGFPYARRHIIVANSDDGCLTNDGGVLTHETEGFEDKFVEAVRHWRYTPGQDPDTPSHAPTGPEPKFPWTQALLTPAVRQTASP